MFRYDRLEELIKESGKSKTYLCKQLDRPAYYLRDVIRQQNVIPTYYQYVLAYELDTTVDYLNDKSDIPHPDYGNRRKPLPPIPIENIKVSGYEPLLTEEEAAISDFLDKFILLTPDNQELIRKMVESLAGAQPQP
jgi:hypothetical protein